MQWAPIGNAQEGTNRRSNIIRYIGPSLIPKRYNIRYVLIIILLLYGLVTPTTIYGWTGGRRCFFFLFWRHLFWKGVFQSNTDNTLKIFNKICQCVVNIGVPKSHFRLNRRPQALFFLKNDLPFKEISVWVNILLVLSTCASF